MKTSAIILASLFVAACGTTADIKKHDSAEIIYLQFQNDKPGDIQITGELADGTTLKGEFGALSADNAALAASAQSLTGSGYSWSAIQGYKFTRADGGLVIECAYGTRGFPSQGHGRCRDNKGKHYRLEF